MLQDRADPREGAVADHVAGGQIGPGRVARGSGQQVVAAPVDVGEADVLDDGAVVDGTGNAEVGHHAVAEVLQAGQAAIGVAIDGQLPDGHVGGLDQEAARDGAAQAGVLVVVLDVRPDHDSGSAFALDRDRLGRGRVRPEVAAVAHQDRTGRVHEVHALLERRHRAVGRRGGARVHRAVAGGVAAVRAHVDRRGGGGGQGQRQAQGQRQPEPGWPRDSCQPARRERSGGDEWPSVHGFSLTAGGDSPPCQESTSPEG